MDETDRIFVALFEANAIPFPVIACLFTGSLPRRAALMPRDPEPQIGAVLDEGFQHAVREALKVNAAVHDGAIMVGRRDRNSPYQIAAWSYRLFPPEVKTDHSNRGSAFNSCLAMSAEAGVDCVYLVSREGPVRFWDGHVSHLEVPLR